MHGRQLDRFEQEDAAFHERVRAGFREMAAEDPDHWAVVDASAGMDEVAAVVRDAVRERLGL
jgi:dTMP kinase